MSPGHQLAISASRRAAARTYLEMKRGVDSLATITSIGALLGLGLTIRDTLIWFASMGTPTNPMICRVSTGPSEALVPTALGLALSLLALTLHDILETQLHAFETEMRHRPAELLALLPR